MEINEIIQNIKDHKRNLTLNKEEQKKLFLYIQDLYNSNILLKDKIDEIIDILEIYIE